MYRDNIEMRSCNRCLRFKSNKYFTYPEGVFVALGIQHAKRMSRIFICCLPFCTVFSHIIAQRAWFSWRGYRS